MIPHRHWRPLSVALAITAGSILLAAPSVRAQGGAGDEELQVRPFDILELASGTRLEGEILAERGDEIVFRQQNGIQSTLSRGTIRKLLRKNPPERVYAARLARGFDPKRLADQLALASWCLEPGVGLIAKGILHFEEAAILEPARRETYEALLPLWGARAASAANTAETDRELATCLLGVGAGVELPALAVHAARRLVAFGDPRAAILLLEPLGERSGDDAMVASAQDLLAGLLIAEDRREEARERVERWLAARSGAAALPLWRLRSELLLEDVAAGVDGAAERLAETIERILAVDPEDGRAVLHRGTLAYLRGDLVRSRADFERAFLLGENSAEPAVTYALQFGRGGESDSALELLRSARNSAAVADLQPLVEAYVRENIGETDVAVDLLERAVAAEDATWQGWVISLQGRSRLSEGFPLEREAVAALERFGANPAAFAELSALIGDAAHAAGRPAEARRWLGYAVAAGRALPEVLVRLGLAHLSTGGDPRLAREFLERAVAEAPGDADARNALACLEYRTGELERAREHFEAALRAAPAPSEKDAAAGGQPSPAHAYALAGLELVDRTLGEEVWTDDFARPDGAQILNNWEKRETFGIAIELRDGAVRFSGTQRFQPDGLTRLHRPVDPSNLARVRARLRIPEARVAARIGLRLTRLEGSEEGDGIVVYRDLDGVIAVALLVGGEAEVIRSDAPAADHEDLELVPTTWPTDGAAHLLELRLPRTEEDVGASVYLDGVPVIRGIEITRLKGRGLAAIAGVSGQADLDRSYSFDVLDFELYRRKPRSEAGGTNR